MVESNGFSALIAQYQDPFAADPIEHSLMDLEEVQKILVSTLAELVDAGVAGAGDVVELSPLDRQPLYHYLHKRHAALVKPLSAELKKMWQDGSIQKIWDTSAKEDL